MCGIAGLVRPCNTVAEDSVEDLGRLRRALDALSPRGPDSTSWGNYAGCFVGSTRLAVNDPSRATQPLIGCVDDALAVFLNGEIYNHDILDAGLLDRGHRRRTGGDGECIAHLFEEHGLDFVHHLRGAFAIALVNRRAGQLILVRDRLGEKPLLYSVRRTKRAGAYVQFAFASEVRALLPMGVPMDLDDQALVDYLFYGFVPEPLSIVSAARKLPAGHMLIINYGTGEIIGPTCWWDELELVSVDEEPATSERGLQEAVLTAVRQQIQTDSDVAVALSSGVDSTLLAGIASQHRAISALTVDFAWEPAALDVHEARALAHRRRFSHNTIVLGADYYSRLVGESARLMTEPIADWSAPAYLSLARECRHRGTKVLMTGHGPDEVLWGYKWVQSAFTALRRSGQGPENLYEHNPEYLDVARLLGRRPTSVVPQGSVGLLDRQQNRLSLAEQVIMILIRGYLRSNGSAQLDGLVSSQGVEVRTPYIDSDVLTAAAACGRQMDRSPLDHDGKEPLRRLATAMGASRAPKLPFHPPIRVLTSILNVEYDMAAAYHSVVDKLFPDSEEGMPHPAGLRNATFGFRCLVFSCWLESLQATTSVRVAASPEIWGGLDASDRRCR